MQYLQPCSVYFLHHDSGRMVCVTPFACRRKVGIRKARRPLKWTEPRSLEPLAGANARRNVERAVAGIRGRQPRALRCVRFSLHCDAGQRLSRGRSGGSKNAAIQRGAPSIRRGESECHGRLERKYTSEGCSAPLPRNGITMKVPSFTFFIVTGSVASLLAMLVLLAMVFG